MARTFLGRPVELLAPAGTFDIFREVVARGCDAVYFGGKHLNMRLHRKDYNFTDDQLRDAVDLAHSLGKKAYITVNNLYHQGELAQLEEFLLYLAQIGPDAILVQDMAVLSLIKKLGIAIPVHASVMMNAHNLEMVRALEAQGVSRVVLSREAPLSYARLLAAETGVEMEYFVHGDMCVAHGSQCIYSGMLFGQSANRGRCLKVCRWPFRVERDSSVSTMDFPMAVKDMCLYRHIPALIHNRVTAFKLEGRMRDADYIKGLVDLYADAMDRYLADPLAFDREGDYPALEAGRKRDLSTAYAFGVPGLHNINRRGEGTGSFYSTGKMFSTATPERDTTPERLAEIQAAMDEAAAPAPVIPQLTVRVNNMAQARACIREGADILYLAGDVFLPDKPFSREDIQALRDTGNAQILLGLPRMTADQDLEAYVQAALDAPAGGYLVTNLGAIRALQGHSLVGDDSLNIYNPLAAAFYLDMGLDAVTFSLELKLAELLPLARAVEPKGELIVHGAPTVMYLEHDLYANAAEGSDPVLYLVDEAGSRHPVRKDRHGRNHLLLCKELCLLPLVDHLRGLGLGRLRIEGRHMDPNRLGEVVRLYRQALDNPGRCGELYGTLLAKGNAYTLGALEF